MTKEQLAALRPGDLVRHKRSAHAMIVHANYGGHVVAAKIAHVSNPDEWDAVRPDGSVIE